MKKEIKQIIKDTIKKSYETQLEDIKNHFEHRNKQYIGTELSDISKPKVKVLVPRVSQKNGRTYYHTEYKYQTYIYTQELYDKALSKALEQIKPNCTHRFKVSADDSNRVISVEDALNLSDSEIEAIYNMYEPYYRDHLVNFEIKKYHYCGNNSPATYQGIYPVFEDKVNKEFYDAINDYCRKKAEWCDKYGCD